MITQAEQEAYLAHHGVKGMKWGVRRDKGHEGEQAKTKTIEKLDRKFERSHGNLSTQIRIHNAAARATNENDVERINNKPKYKDADLSRDTPLRRQYYKEHQKAFIDNVVKAAEAEGTNASGTRKYRVVEDDDGGWLLGIQDVVKHENLIEGESGFKIILKKDARGHILSMTMGEEVQPKVLAHYGIKGMKWGVRRSGKSTVNIVDQKTGEKTPIKVVRGVKIEEQKNGSLDLVSNSKRAIARQNEEIKKATEKPSTDHTESRELLGKSTKTLSNAELKKLNQRLQLEKSYSELTSNDTSVKRGEAKVKTALGYANTGQQIYNTLNSPAARAIKEVVKAAM